MRKLTIIILLTVLAFSLFSVSSYAQDCVRMKPTISVSPSTITTPTDTTLSLTLTIRNEDPQLCGASKFGVTASLPTGWTKFVHPDSISVFPGQSEFVTIDITVPKDAAKQQHQVIIVVDSPNHNTPDLKNSLITLVTVRDEPKTCSLSIDDIILRKAATDIEKITFCLKEKVDIDAKISVRGNTEAQVFADAFINGKLVDSKAVTIKPDNFATINFNSSVDTQVYGKSTPNVKVVAKAACASSDATREKRFTIDICDPRCLFFTSIAVPQEKQVGQDIIASIYTRNIGNKENLIAIEPAVCKDSNCIPMVCDISSAKLQPDESKTYSCKYTVRSTGSHAMETKLFSCGGEETQTKAFTGIGQTTTGQLGTQATACKVESLVEYRCSGSIRQQLFRNSDCSTTWVYSSYCPNGCTNGLCISTAEEVKGLEPALTLEKEFQAKACKDIQLSFDLENSISSPAKFDLKTSGKAASWISMPPSVIIGERTKEHLTFSASIPCNVPSGDYGFSVVASTGSRSASKSSSIKVMGENQGPGAINIPTEVGVGVVGGIIILYILSKFL